MIQNLIDGIVAALTGAFPGVKVYDEPVRQGLVEPCFMVGLANGTNNHVLGNRFYRTCLFSVQYIPQSRTDAKAECSAVTEQLYQSLTLITVNGDLQRGVDMNAVYL